jgi:hypothetical protein
MSRLFLLGKSCASLVSLGVACALLASCGARQDGFDWGRMVLFSAISGTLVKDGKPVAGAKITREANFHGSKHSDSTVTDKDGNFSFETMKTFTLLYQVLPSEPVVIQRVFVRAGDKSYEIWSYAKFGYEDNSELKYNERIGEGVYRDLKITTTTNPIKVACELSNDRKPVGFISSTCSFSPPDPVSTTKK